MFLIGVVAFEALTGNHPFSPSSDPGNYVNRMFRGNVDMAALARVDNVENFKVLLLRLLKPREGYRYWHHATSRWYSWTIPPSRSRLRTAPVVSELDEVGGEGRASRSPRCGLSAL